MPDAERIDEAVERDLPPRIDRGEQIGGARRAPALAVLKLVLRPAVAPGEREDVGRRLDQLVVIELRTIFSPMPSMSKALRDTKCLQPLDPLRRADQAAGAAAHRIGLAGLRVASRTAWLPQTGQACGNR